MPFRSAPLDVSRIALEAFRNAQRLAGGQVLKHAVQPGVRVCGDPDRLHQLILILLDNALKFTPAGRSVGLIVTEDQERVLLVVQDEGPGIPAADQAHVFERFYRADPGRARDPGGTGLGLPIAAWIVEQHQGSIELKSEEGHGTRVEVTLKRGG
ncbi:sensor histidine kinase [Deinococcus malanensis]|uniref:sensor histidine kinase n=1 Tax=Deinococcus malanensis TaxID=1706855 RepID=UPI003638E6B0